MRLHLTIGRATALAALLGVAILPAACAPYNAAVSAATSYASTQVTAQQANIQALNDVAAKTWADGGCAIPYGELVRNGSGNPNFAQAVISLCGGPSGYTMIHGAAVPIATTTIPTTIVTVPTPQQTTAAP
jgi:hypothetical protein